MVHFRLLAADEMAPKVEDHLSASIEAVTLHRLFRGYYMGGEHFEGEESTLGDALGVDCLVQEVGEDGIVRAFGGDGLRNEDWFGWNVEVLAPFDGVVEAVHINPVVNRPGSSAMPLPAPFAFGVPTECA